MNNFLVFAKYLNKIADALPIFLEKFPVGRSSYSQLLQVPGLAEEARSALETLVQEAEVAVAVLRALCSLPEWPRLLPSQLDWILAKGDKQLLRTQEWLAFMRDYPTQAVDIMSKLLLQPQVVPSQGQEMCAYWYCVTSHTHHYFHSTGLPHASKYLIRKASTL